MIGPITECYLCSRRIEVGDLIVLAHVLPERTPPPGSLGDLRSALSGCSFEAAHLGCADTVGSDRLRADPGCCARCGNRARRGDLLTMAYPVGDVSLRGPGRVGPHLGLEVDRPHFAHYQCRSPGSPCGAGCPGCGGRLLPGERALLLLTAPREGDLLSGNPEGLRASLGHGRCPSRGCPLLWGPP